tara:strand:+ start:195 stop:368 length:174 start_codon:yes stop_codon:yes gene_type:complete
MVCSSPSELGQKKLKKIKIMHKQQASSNKLQAGWARPKMNKNQLTGSLIWDKMGSCL